ncbi:MAG: DUF4019 domain-containing protein [Chthoniobacterales bacterium]
MKMLCRFVLIFLVTINISEISYADENVNQAVKVARDWLILVDAGEYQKSWQEAAPIFKESTSIKKWSNLVALVREPLGEVKSRKLIHAQFTETLPGAPKGEYVVIQFQTDFADKHSAIETITPMKVKGVWKVSGYFIK